jgi:uncharacterized membrane protein
MMSKKIGINDLSVWLKIPIFLFYGYWILMTIMIAISLLYLL